MYIADLVAPLGWFVPQDIFALMPRYSQRPAKEEVINDPTVTKHYWRYRCVMGKEHGQRAEVLPNLKCVMAVTGATICRACGFGHES